MTQEETTNINKSEFSVSADQHESISHDLVISLFHAHVSEGNLNSVSHAIENGQDPNATDCFGRSPLHIASEHGNGLMVNILACNGADILITDRYGKTPGDVAAYLGHDDALSAIIGSDQSLNSDTRYKMKSLFLHEAARGGQLKTFKYLLNIGADIDYKQENGWSVLQYSSYGGNLKIVKKCLELGLRVDGNDEALIKCSPLYIAIFKGHLKIIKFLLEEGVDVDTDNHPLSKFQTQLVGSETSLSIALDKEMESVARKIIVNGADVNAANKVFIKASGVIVECETPLHKAVRHCSTDMVKFLIKSGANILVKDHEDQTPRQIAHLMGRKNIVKLIDKAHKKKKRRMQNMKSRD